MLINLVATPFKYYGVEFIFRGFKRLIDRGCTYNYKKTKKKT